MRETMSGRPMSGRQFEEAADGARRAMAEGAAFVADRGEPSRAPMSTESCRRLSDYGIDAVDTSSMRSGVGIDVEPPGLLGRSRVVR